MFHTCEELAEIDLQLKAAKIELSNLNIVDYDSNNRAHYLEDLIAELEQYFTA